MLDNAGVAIGLEFLDPETYVSSVITVSSGDSRLENVNEVSYSETDISDVDGGLLAP